jgi:phosphinothricin acetyltransferase
MGIAIRDATRSDAAAVAAIYNQGISERSATFETEPRSEAQMAARIDQIDRYPMLVVVDDGDDGAGAGVVVGWAGLTEYNPRPCYTGIGEFSIYLAPEARRRGVGKVLLLALIEAARDRGYWKIVSRVFPFNAASRGLCRACGFREVGIYEKHARLDGRWLDIVIVERLIENPLLPQ